jgi:F-type H+-transporting ATPase subunit delta
MSTETIARRYSTALADVLLKQGDKETVRTELEVVGKLFEENGELRSVFGNPAITHANKERLLDALIAKTNPSDIIANFLKVLLQNGRLNDITEINDRFGSILEERSGSVSAQIISARELPSGERAEFEKQLEAITGKRVNINYTIDENIIGGVVTRIGSTVFDGSVRTKLENLKEQLVNG